MDRITSLVRKFLTTRSLLPLPLLVLFQCSEPQKEEETQRTPQYVQKSKDSLEDDRPNDERAIGGQKLGEIFAAKTDASPDPSAPNGNPQGPANPSQPSMPPAPAPPVPPTPTHVATVTCGALMTMNFTFGGQKTGGSVSVTSKCPQLATALNGLAFPTGKTTPKPTGGPTVEGTCDDGTLTFSARDMGAQSQVATTLTFKLESVPVCLEIRNVINGLNL